MFCEIFYNQKRRKRTPLQYISIPFSTLKQEEALLCPIILSAHVISKTESRLIMTGGIIHQDIKNVYKFVVVERTQEGSK